MGRQQTADSRQTHPRWSSDTLIAVCRVLCAVCLLIGLTTDPAWAFGRPEARFWFPEAASTYGQQIDQLFVLILWITGSIFLLVEGALLWFLIRYRQRAGQSAAYIHGHINAEIIWTIIPALIVLYLAFGSQRVWSQIQGPPPPHELEVEVQGEQFAWNIRYAGADGQLGTEDDLETINQLHLPVDQVTLLRLTSKDVIHSFFLPHFRLKRDAVPGLTSRIWLEPTTSGDYEIVCAELCGLGHYRMRGFVTIESPEDFEAWLKQMIAEQTG